MESQQIRVAINGVEPQMMDMMVNYAYTSKVLISTANVQVTFYQHKPYSDNIIVLVLYWFRFFIIVSF